MVAEQALEVRSSEIVASVQEFAANLDSKEKFDQSLEMRKKIAEMKREVESHHAPMIQAATASLNAAREARDRLLNPLVASERVLMDARAKWQLEESRREAERLRLIQEEQMRIARQRAEEERARLERQRAEAMERARKEAEERRLQEAIEAEQRGEEERAQALIQASIEVEEPVDALTPAEIDAIAEATQAQAAAIVSVVAPTVKAPRMNYSAQCVSIRELAAAVARGDVPDTYITPNQTALNAVARAQKDQFRVPGCRVIAAPVDNIRGGR